MDKVSILVRREAVRVLVVAGTLWPLEIGCGRRILLTPSDGFASDAKDDGGSNSTATANAEAGSDDDQAGSTGTGTTVSHDASVGTGGLCDYGPFLSGPWPPARRTRRASGRG
jgi:hypothetical protein